jgi:excisionase family DNA binding protein
MVAWQKRVVDLMERGGVSVKEFAEVSGISKSKIYELIAQGHLRTLSLPGCNRKLIHPSELARYLEASAA